MAELTNMKTTSHSKVSKRGHGLNFAPFNVLVSLLFIVTGMTAQQTFTNISGVSGDQSNIGFTKDGGASFADYDLDGDLDLIVNTNDNNAARRSYLLRNDNGIYIDVTMSVAPDLKTSRMERSAAWGDFNNDGYPDLLINTSNGIKVLRNNAGTTLTTIFDISTMIDGMNTEGAGWLDYDMDGDMDFFVENHNNGVDVFRNEFPSTSPYFSQVTINAIGAPGTGAGGLGLPEGGSVEGDYGTSSDLNQDGYPDILVRRDNTGTNSGVDQNTLDIFINDGDGTFTANTSINDDTSNWNKGGLITGDFDNDGDFDILWTSASTSGNLSVVYENTGNNSMVFSPVANPFFLEGGGPDTSSNFDGCAIGDIDNDGDLDLFMTQNAGTSKLYLNSSSGPGNFAFRQPGPSWIPGAATNYGIDVNGNGEGCAFADFDNDGDLDLYVNKTGANQLWRNDYIGSAAELAATYQNNYLRVIVEKDLGGGLTTLASNATVRLLDCGSNQISGIREVGAGGASHGSQTSPWLHFGLNYGPESPYLIEVTFTRNGTTPIVVTKVATPSDLSPISPGSSSLALEQTIVVRDTDADDTLACDADQDGVLDGIDLDDDNDGIPDYLECNLLSNWDFEANTGLNFGNNVGTIPVSWAVTAASPNIIFVDGPAGSTYGIGGPEYDGDGGAGQYFDITGTAAVFQTFSIPTGGRFLFGGKGSARDNSSGPVEFQIRQGTGTGGTLMATSGAQNMTDNTTWTLVQQETLLNAGTYTFIAVMNNFTNVDDLFVSGQCDDDGDGIPNQRDLDSDNDGIHDLKEGGHGATDSNLDGIIDGLAAAFGSNGLFNGVELIVDSGILNYTIADSDSDDNPDFIELDSDNDGCSDANEAYTDANADGGDDGIYGSGAPAVNADGTVVAAAYTAPADVNTNGTAEFQEAGAVPTITVDPMNSVTFVNTNDTFSSTDDGDDHQWQVSTDGGATFNDIVDGPEYTGTGTNTVTIIAPGMDKNGHQYRVVITSNTFVCGETISAPALLTVGPRTIITNRRITYRVNKN